MARIDTVPTPDDRRQQRENVARRAAPAPAPAGSPTGAHLDRDGFTAMLLAGPPDPPIDGHRQLTVRLPTALRVALEDYSRAAGRTAGRPVSDRAVVQLLLEQLLSPRTHAGTHARTHADTPADGGS